jgi:glycosyltransferase involved in cell wall biosynthesis
MKVLWLSNKLLSPNDEGKTGTWLDALAEMLINSGEVELGNIAFGPVSEMTRMDWGPVRQWAVPKKMSFSNGLPHRRDLSGILNATEMFSPDLVQVWGTECFWGLLTARKYITKPVLLEIQGLKYAIAPVYSGGLTFREQLSCIGLKECINRSSIFQVRRKYEAWGKMEKEIIAGHHFISTMLKWASSQVRAINPACRTFRCDRMLRKPFYTAVPHYGIKNCRIFCSAAYSSPFKGLHVALRAMSHLKDRFPKVELRIAGALQRKGVRRDGYIDWINREVERLGVRSSIVWLGALNAPELIREIQNCAVVVVPSFMESYGLALSEAMILGVPVVSSFAGSLPDLARHNDTALFFPPGDSFACAFQMERILNDRNLAIQISQKARQSALARHDPERILTNQLAIYRQVIHENKSNEIFRRDQISSGKIAVNMDV